MEQQTGRMLALAFCLASIPATLSQALSPVYNGITTFYGGPQDNLSPYVPSFGLVKGSCGYGYLGLDGWPNGLAAAISPGSPIVSGGNQKGCGACIQITCTSDCMPTAKPMTVVVTDTCDTCAPNQVNVHALAFSQYFNPDFSIGQVSTSWQQVACNPPGDIQAKVVDFRAADGTFIAVAPFQVAGNGVISNLEIQGSDQRDWQSMQNKYGAVWQASGLSSPPFSLRFTGSDGTQLVATGAIKQLANGTYPTGVQFGGVKSVPAASPPQQSQAAPPQQSQAAPPQQSQAAAPQQSAPAPPVAAQIATPPAPAAGPPAVPLATALPPAQAPETSALPSKASGVAPAPAPLTVTAAAVSPAAGVRSTVGPSPAGSPQAPGPVTLSPTGLRRAPGPSPMAAVPSTSPSASPGTTSLMLNSSLSGDNALAGNSILNPSIMLTGRRLQR